MTTTPEQYETQLNPYLDPDFDGVQDPYTDDAMHAMRSVAAPVLRTKEQARDWALAQIDHRSSPYGTWYRYCLAFDRLAWNAQYAIDMPRRDAGSAWDVSTHKHRTDDPMAIPFGAGGAYIELPSVADHVVFPLGNGWCISNDILRPGYVDKVPIQTILSRWGGQLLGWTEDIVGNPVWTPPPPPDPKTPHITAYFQADDLEGKVAALKAVLHGDNDEAKPIAQRLLDAHLKRQDTTERIGTLRKSLRKEQVR